MRKFIPLFLVVFLTSSFSVAQVLNPVAWTNTVSTENAKTGDEIEIIFKAVVDGKWYLYSSDFDPDCGPLLTTVVFTELKNFKTVGDLIPVNPELKHDKVFDCDVKIFKKTAEFRQKIKVLGGPLNLSGSISGQVCTEVDGKCI